MLLFVVADEKPRAAGLYGISSRQSRNSLKPEL